MMFQHINPWPLERINLQHNPQKPINLLNPLPHTPIIRPPNPPIRQRHTPYSLPKLPHQIPRLPRRRKNPRDKRRRHDGRRRRDPGRDTNREQPVCLRGDSEGFGAGVEYAVACKGFVENKA
jgi:hypothetical protein